MTCMNFTRKILIRFATNVALSGGCGAWRDRTGTGWWSTNTTIDTNMVLLAL